MSSLRKVLNNIIDEIDNNKDYLTDLDRAIGDGDHGVNLSRGVNKVKENLDSLDGMPLHDVFNKISMTLLSNVGGASGALYGSALLKASSYLKNKSDVSIEDFVGVFESFISGIQSRGKAELGDKTMLDTLIPTYEVFKTEVENKTPLNIILDKIELTAKDSMEKTKDMVAKKGRASYLGERSIGHIDPGSASSYLIIKSICESLR